MGTSSTYLRCLADLRVDILPESGHGSGCIRNQVDIVPRCHPPRQWDRRNLIQNPYPLLHRFYRTIFQCLVLPGAQDDFGRNPTDLHAIVHEYPWYMHWKSKDDHWWLDLSRNLSGDQSIYLVIYKAWPCLLFYAFPKNPHFLRGAALECYSENRPVAVHIRCQRPCCTI